MREPRIKVEFRRDVTSPHFLAGKKGETKELLLWHAEQLIEEGFARPLECPDTGEPIVYPPDPPPPPKPGRKWVVVNGPAPNSTTVTQDAKDGTAEQATNSGLEKAPIGESADTRLG